MGLELAGLYQDLARGAEAFQSLRYTAIDTNHVNNGADLFNGDPIAEGAFTMQFPLMHFSQSADHRQVHHRARFGVNHIIAPAKAPTLSGHRLLEGSG